MTRREYNEVAIWLIGLTDRSPCTHQPACGDDELHCQRCDEAREERNRLPGDKSDK